MLTNYAYNPLTTKGRLYQESPALYRNEFARDRDRIVHSCAFQRLQYKTQVFINHEGDHYRNRLTHSLEVSLVARSVARMLNLSDDLAEAVALAHDLGHAPFGHAGERALNECMQGYGGFSHNAHALKIITKLEKLYAAYDGLNLTWEVLEGIVKHNGPLVGPVPSYILEYNVLSDLDLANYSSAEAQLASLSDDITYICHDLKDSVRAKLVDLSQLAEMPLIDHYISAVKAQYKDNLTDASVIFEVSRKLTNYLITNLLLQTKLNLQQQPVEDTSDVRRLVAPLVDFPDATKQQILQIKQFLFKNVYRHQYILSINGKCQKIIKQLFELYMNDAQLLPLHWRALIDCHDLPAQALVVSDYIAGMTDRFAIQQHQSFYHSNFDNI